LTENICPVSSLSTERMLICKVPLFNVILS